MVAERNCSGAFDISLSLDVKFLNTSQENIESCNIL